MACYASYGGEQAALLAQMSSMAKCVEECKEVRVVHSFSFSFGGPASAVEFSSRDLVPFLLHHIATCSAPRRSRPSGTLFERALTSGARRWNASAARASATPSLPPLLSATSALVSSRLCCSAPDTPITRPPVRDIHAFSRPDLATAGSDTRTKKTAENTHALRIAKISGQGEQTPHSPSRTSERTVTLDYHLKPQRTGCEERGTNLSFVVSCRLTQDLAAFREHQGALQSQQASLDALHTRLIADLTRTQQALAEQHAQLAHNDGLLRQRAAVAQSDILRQRDLALDGIKAAAASAAGQVAAAANAVAAAKGDEAAAGDAAADPGKSFAEELKAAAGVSKASASVHTLHARFVVVIEVSLYAEMSHVGYLASFLSPSSAPDNTFIMGLLTLLSALGVGFLRLRAAAPAPSLRLLLHSCWASCYTPCFRGARPACARPSNPEEG